MARLNENQLLLAVGGAALLLCTAGGLGIWWAYGLVDEEGQAIEAKRAEIKVARDKIAKIPDVERDVIILRENVHEYVNILPQQKEVTTFMRSANTFAAQAGIDVDNFAPVPQNASRGAFERVAYRFEFQASIWQAMKFVNFFENHERFVKVRDIRLNSKRVDVRSDTEAKHSISMTVETYVYDTKGNSKLTQIANYPNKRDKLRHTIAANLQNLSLEKYDFKGPEGRRDIFVDPREFATAGLDGPGLGRLPSETQRKMIEQFGARLSKLTEMWDRSNDSTLTIFQRYELRQQVNKAVVEMDVGIEDVNKKSLISNPALKVRWFKEVVQAMKGLKGKIANQDDPDQFLAEKDFKRLIDNIKKHLLSGELDAAIHQYEAVAQQVEVPPQDKRFNLRVQLESLLVRARIAKEFATIPLKVSGVVVNEGGKSGLILNNKVYEEGDFIGDQLFVKAVRREEIEFVYKGFTLVKTW